MRLMIETCETDEIFEMIVTIEMLVLLPERLRG